MTSVLLALNAGSSSFKFAVADANACTEPVLTGMVERLGSSDARLRTLMQGGTAEEEQLGSVRHSEALGSVFDVLERRLPGSQIVGVGHRIVHGGADLVEPVRITPKIVAALTAMVPLAPLHQPHGLAGIAAVKTRFSKAVQVACFDTAFHAGKPLIHEIMALPRRFFDLGLRRFGFHGIACESICHSLATAGYPLERRKVAIAHLGNGCSVTAVRNGRSVANSMGFSPLDGLAMGTRCGEIDPGALIYLLRHGYDIENLERLLYYESGLVGLSGISADLRDLSESKTEGAVLAIEYFLERVVGEICQMAGAMRGLDCVVFSGGIGENADWVRQAVMEKLSFIKDENSKDVQCIVQPADEERQLLLSTYRLS